MAQCTSRPHSQTPLTALPNLSLIPVASLQTWIQLRHEISTQKTGGNLPAAARRYIRAVYTTLFRHHLVSCVTANLLLPEASS
jgi:hypothetical protein